MATICARRRLIRDGAELKNEPNCRISPIPKLPAEAVIPQAGARPAKMFSRPASVETAVKIATHPSSDGQLAVDFLSLVARQRSKSSPRKFRRASPIQLSNGQFRHCERSEDVSRTRCSVLHDAPQSRDPRGAWAPDQQRTTPQEQRVAQHPGHANTDSHSRGVARPSDA
jgi:hypothetical protein